MSPKRRSGRPRGDLFSGLGALAVWALGALLVVGGAVLLVGGIVVLVLVLQGWTI